MAKTVETKELTEVSEAQIAVHWKEEEYYQPSEKFKAQANLRDPHVFAKFGLDKFPDCFKTYADMLTWFPYLARWRSTQLYAALILPPTNHFQNGASLVSRTV